MRFHCAFAALFLYAAKASAEELYANARVVPNVLPAASLSQLTDDVGQIRLLRGNSEDGTNRRYGKTTVSTEDLELILNAIGAERPVHAPTSVRSTLLSGNTDPHRDLKVNADEFDDDETVVFVFLDSVPGAFFQIGDDKIPAEEGALVTFKGNSMLHNTIVPSGSELRLLGPIASRDLQEVKGPPPTNPPTTSPTQNPTTGTPTTDPTQNPTTAPTTGTPTSAPTTGAPTTPTLSPTVDPLACEDDVVCKPGVCFEAIPKEECPTGKHLGLEIFFKVHHGCNEHVPVGALCEGDGECGTSNHVNNCKALDFHKFALDLDVYRRVECCDGTTTPPATGCCVRRLKEGDASLIKEDMSLHEVLEIIRSHGADADASFSEKHDLLSKESCDALIDHLEVSLSKDVASGKDLPVASKGIAKEDHDSWIEFEDGGINNMYDKKLDADELVKLIGATEALKILKFFRESFGDLPVNEMYIARHGPGEDEVFYNPWHKDDYANLEVTLNGDYDGGHFLELNSEGVHKIENKPGSAFSHGADMVHGMTPNTNGAKYQLILKHHYNRPAKEAARLSEDLVREITK